MRAATTSPPANQWPRGRARIVAMSKRRLALGVVAVGLLAVVVTLKDAVRARVFALGCRLGSGDACFKGALLYRHADSTALLKRGCEALAHVDSCMALTDAIAVGIAGPPDFAHAEKMCRRRSPFQSRVPPDGRGDDPGTVRRLRATRTRRDVFQTRMRAGERSRMQRCRRGGRARCGVEAGRRNLPRLCD